MSVESLFADKDFVIWEIRHRKCGELLPILDRESNVIGYQCANPQHGSFTKGSLEEFTGMIKKELGEDLAQNLFGN